MVEWYVLGATVLFIPYAYIIVRIISYAFFAERYNYQQKLIKHLDQKVANAAFDKESF